MTDYSPGSRRVSWWLLVAKSVTLKDVLYVMQFGGEDLIGRIGRRGFAWTLSHSGTAVDTHIVEAVRREVNVIAIAAAPGTSRLGWRRAA